MRKAVWIIPAVAGGFYMTVRYFFRFALYRNVKQQFAPLGDSTEYEERIRRGKCWLREHETETVECQSFDGYRLKGHYYEFPEAEKTLLFFHGWRGNWDGDFAAFTEYFGNGKFNLLVVEERAHGASDGRYIGMGVLEHRDVLSWLHWYQKRKNRTKLPVYLMGVSMGAASVLMASGKKLPGVKGIIADCAYTNAYEVFKNFGKARFHVTEYPLIAALNQYCIWKTGVDLKDGDVRKYLGKCRVPVLFVHGKADSFIPPECAEKNYKACPADKQLVLIDGAEHAMSFLVNKEQYILALNQFFKFS